MLSFYTTCLIFIFGCLAASPHSAGFFKFIRYIKEEPPHRAWHLVLRIGAAAHDREMENLGCDTSVVGLVIPTGYSFNLDGTCIYLTMAAIFLAQATNTDLTLWQQLGIIGDPALTSKGAAGVTGLASSCSPPRSLRLEPSPASIALILGIDADMSEARALTNLIGNGVATVVVAKWEDALDEERLHRRLNQETDAEADDPEAVKVEDDVIEEGGPRPVVA